MEGIYFIMFIFLCISVVDKIRKNKHGYGQDFDTGIATMGPVAMCLIGMYGLGTYLVENNTEHIANLSNIMPFDPSLIIGMLLASDFGSLPICLGMADTRAMGLFSGIALGATIGASISFSIPSCLAAIKGKKDTEHFLIGAAIGIATILPGACISGLVYEVNGIELIINCIPLALICLALIAGFMLSPKKTSAALGAFGNIVMAICTICFAIVSFGILFPERAFIDSVTLGDAVLSTAKMAIIIVGSLSFTKFAIRHFNPLLKFLANLMKTNEYAVVGLVLSLTTCIAMIPIYKLMDRRGQKINAAFAISGSFIIGGQMSYCSIFTTSEEMVGFFICKIISGILAISVVCMLDTARSRTMYSIELYNKLNENTRRAIMVNSNENSVNISLSCSNKLLEAMGNNPELNAAVNAVIERFFNSDWGYVSEDAMAENDKVILVRQGKIEAEYKTDQCDFSVEMTFSDKENASVMVDFLEE